MQAIKHLINNSKVREQPNWSSPDCKIQFYISETVEINFSCFNYYHFSNHFRLLGAGVSFFAVRGQDTCAQRSENCLLDVASSSPCFFFLHHVVPSPVSEVASLISYEGV